MNRTLVRGAVGAGFSGSAREESRGPDRGPCHRLRRLAHVRLHPFGWFGLWILLNVGALGAAATFDEFPFGLLTMIVSLEAIFLATFVMVSQNRQAERADVRSLLDFETNLRSEIWSVHIGQALGIDVDDVEAVVREAITGSKHQLEA